MTDLIERLSATSETGVTPELIDETIQRIRELEAAIKRIKELPLKLTDDEQSCIAMRKFIEDAITG